MQNDTRKLDQLTALRFFAALLIVLHHLVGLFGITEFRVSLDHGVSFFFVLSGFILTYVYPKLDTWIEVKKFWRARVARIWPAYLASFLLGIFLLHYRWDSKTAIANLLMAQGWLPMSTYYFSYNAVCWSVSTEFFFYLAFPVLIASWSKNWLIKLMLSSVVLIALIVFSNVLSLQPYGNPDNGSDGLLITQHGLLYISPLSRIFEFVVGMCVALAWRKNLEIKRAALLATSYELGAIILCAITMHYMRFIAEWSKNSIFGEPASVWVAHSGSVFAFGLLIYVAAQGRGNISKMLAHPFLVILGEISFSIYLTHQILLEYYSATFSKFMHIPNPIALGIFFGVLLLTSYLMWACIEMPSRRLIMGHKKIHGTAIMRKSWNDHFMLSRNTFFAGLALGCTIGLINFTMGKANFLSQILH